MNDDVVRAVAPLGFQWPTLDPFLFCVHHDDAYPAGNEAMGPAAPLDGRDLGQDFAGKDGWRMYHGQQVPGFPGHPHRGFETVTIVRRGLIDHSDSLGATARFGNGDVQWLTAGRGIVHSEMFPLIERTAPNPLELFQIWVNLPAKHKMAEPYFEMLWNEQIPTSTTRDASGKATHVTVIAGRMHDVQAPSPPPHSWAAQADADVAIWTIKMDAGATWTLPAAGADSHRVLYAFTGAGLRIGARDLPSRSGIQLRADVAVEISAGAEPIELLLLQGRPIAEPVAQQGPFVMNTRAELQQAFSDYQRTRFGGWPYPEDAPVHPRDAGRFARRPDGRLDRPPSS